MMTTQELFELLYSKKMILNNNRDIDEIEYVKLRAKQINDLMNRQIFDHRFISELSKKTPYTEIEECYHLILQIILERASSFSRLKSKDYHVIVTGGIDFRNQTTENNVIIMLEWPMIKFIDLLNVNALQSKTFESYGKLSKQVLDSFLLKYREKEEINIFTSIFPLSSLSEVQYQLTMLLQQIQTVFILSHELGHLLNLELTGLAAEIEADTVAFHSVIEFCKSDKKITSFIIIGIMLLFSYLTLLDVSMKNSRDERINTRNEWLDRYESILQALEKIEITEDEITLVSGYDAICSILNELCIAEIDNTNLSQH